MADTLVERLTGQDRAPDVPVAINADDTRFFAIFLHIARCTAAGAGRSTGPESVCWPQY